MALASLVTIEPRKINRRERTPRESDLWAQIVRTKKGASHFEPPSDERRLPAVTDLKSFLEVANFPRPELLRVVGREPFEFAIVRERASVVAARREFLAAVVEVAPEAYRSLKRRVLGALKRGTNYSDSLVRWQKDWHLTEKWCKRVTLATASIIRQADSEDHRLPPPDEFEYPQLASQKDSQAFVFTIEDHWHRGETWTKFSRRVRKVVNDRLTLYRNNYEASMIGFSPIRDHQFFYYLAAFQVGGYTKAEIAMAAQKSGAKFDPGTALSKKQLKNQTEAVRYAIKRVSSLIELENLRDDAEDRRRDLKRVERLSKILAATQSVSASLDDSPP